MKAAPRKQKVPISAKVDPEIRSAIEKLAAQDDRNISYLVEKILKHSPDVKAVLRKKLSEVAA